MSAEYATFGLAPAIRAGGVLANGDVQVHRDFVDFIVNGRPLLFQLSDLDAVSPLAADIPPAIFTAHVRRLLLEARAPLREGRYVIYGCPECEDLACGAVTAVIEKAPDSDDFIWRDFAWQTAEPADLERNGYHGIGPFRFRGAQYREALGQLLADEPRPRRRVLLIGARVALLAKLAAALRTIGIGAEIAADAADVPPDELRTYGAVAFGRKVTDETRQAVRAAFDRARAEVAYVDGLAPIVPLLVAQIEHALDRSPQEQRRLTALAACREAARLEVTSTCRVQLTAYRMDRLSRTHVHEVFDEILEPGEHRVPLTPKATKGNSYVVARTSTSVLVSPTATP
ncbi:MULTISPECIES: oxidoreductase [Streptomyces]|uniref:oxidoreductase n=1 Tax=Streptomyces TaxID=1883 RepID=UPI001E62AEFE|nr:MULTISPECIES: oxidoreductase [Streptomyces]UFQ19354.1 oxidoreductase [Streptomyces huasconensis]WCL88975.1 oxidoreductase [Streptomyces sp. JCM 35825]